MDREVILKKMKGLGIDALTIGTDLNSSRAACALAETNDHIWACVGQHPLDNPTELFQADSYQQLINTHPKVVCIGECGLDYYWPTKQLVSGELSEDDLTAEKERQAVLLQHNIDLALENDLPLMLHVRSSEDTQDAHEDVLRILEGQQEKLGDTKIAFHFYTEDAALAQRIIAAGYYVSLPGVITFPKEAEKMNEVIRAVPVERLFAETDSPYAAPQKYRGKTNMPLYVREVYEKIAETKGIGVSDLQEQIRKNLYQFLGIQ